MTHRERFMAAIKGEPVDRVPVFPLLMFFAAGRAGLTYRQFATSGSALAEAQLGILERFPIDALTVCSDAFRVSADLGVLAGATKGLSGGDLLNVCVNAIFAGSTADDPADWRITQPILLSEIAKVREAKRQHGERPRRGSERPIGYVTPDSELEG